MDLNILYDYQHEGSFPILKSIANKISSKTNLNIYVEPTRSDDLFNKVSSNPNYHLVIMHIGSENRDPFENIEKLRRFTSSLIVAESRFFLKSARNIKESFDDYLEAQSEESFLRLLQKQGFIEKK